eukprot:jgi/Bigna1/130412/aug1.11_g5120
MLVAKEQNPCDLLASEEPKTYLRHANNWKCKAQELVVNYLCDIKTLGLICKIQFNGTVKKVQKHLKELDDLLDAYNEKFPEAKAEAKDTSFHMKEKQFNVEMTLESVADVYRGAVITVKVKDDSKERTQAVFGYDTEATLKRQLEEMKSKIQALEGGMNPAKRQRRDDNETKDGASASDGGNQTKTGPVLAIRVRGLPWGYKKEDMEEFFKGLEIEAILAILDKFGRESGEAYIVFKDPASAEVAIAKNGEKMGHRYLEIYPVSSAGELQQARRNTRNLMGNGAEEIILRLRGLPWQCTEKMVEEFMQPLQVDKVHLTHDSMGKFKGECLVKFCDAKTAKEGLKKDKEKIGHRYIEIYRSSLAEWDNQTGNYDESKTSAKNMPFVARMRGLPYTCREEDIVEFYRNIPIRKQENCDDKREAEDRMERGEGRGSTEFTTRKRGREREREREREGKKKAKSKEQRAQKQLLKKKNHPICSPAYFLPLLRCDMIMMIMIITMVASSDLLGQCLQRNREKIGHRYVEIFRSNMDEMQMTMGNAGSSAAAQRYVGETFCLKMRGLPFQCTEQMITDFFTKASVTPIRIHRKNNGGEAFVEFQTSSEQRTGLSLHKEHIGRRYIELFPVAYEEVAQIVGLPMDPYIEASRQQQQQQQQLPPQSYGAPQQYDPQAAAAAMAYAQHEQYAAYQEYYANYAAAAAAAAAAQGAQPPPTGYDAKGAPISVQQPPAPAYPPAAHPYAAAGGAAAVPTTATPGGYPPVQGGGGPAYGGGAYAKY